jgi:hypothetical protein
LRALQKHVWRANIILATADGCGTAEIMRRSGKSKPVVWRWQARFMAKGVEGLTRDKTRPPGKLRCRPTPCRRLSTWRSDPTTPFAALNILDGTVIGRNTRHHRHHPVLNTIEEQVPVGKVIRAISRQLCELQGSKGARLARYPR